MSTSARIQQAPLRPPKAKFNMTGIVAGVVAGMVLGFVVETAGRPNSIFMQVGGIVGFATGTLVESVRYWWRKHSHRRWQTKAKQTGTVRR